ncbi:tyrosine-type recombinase/integrase (plasmid) [Tundrisphaera sp. TA3]|uniref:tyrosine-type recombinase/integrase n=1 Tax=Tundrisphaera sp. TA3 TaxID=3435775 RepID=UPI003EBCA9F5
MLPATLPATLPADPSPVAWPAADLAEDFLSTVSGRTLVAYRADLGRLADYMGSAGPGEAAAAFLASGPGEANRLALGWKGNMMSVGLAPATVARRMSSLRALVGWARACGLVAWTIDVKNPRVAAYRDTRGPGRDGVRAIKAAADADAGPTGRRDRAAVALLHDLGLRRGELVALDRADLDLSGDRPTVAIRGKGRNGQVERLTIPAPTAAALAAWLAVHPDPRPDAPLFCRLDRAATGTGRISGEAVRLLVARLGDRAGLAGRPRPHGLRHQGITRALDVSNGNVRAAAKFGRHADPRVTQRYDDARTDLAGTLAALVAADD